MNNFFCVNIIGKIIDIAIDFYSKSGRENCSDSFLDIVKLGSYHLLIVMWKVISFKKALRREIIAFIYIVVCGVSSIYQ